LVMSRHVVFHIGRDAWIDKVEEVVPALPGLPGGGEE